jgi:hypothetical protein
MDMDAPDSSETTVLALMAAGLAVAAAVLAVRVLWWRWRELQAPPARSRASDSRFDALTDADAAASRHAARAASAPPASARPALPARTAGVGLASGLTSGLTSGLSSGLEHSADWLETRPDARPGPTDWTTWAATTMPHGAAGWVRQAFGPTGVDNSLAGPAADSDPGRVEVGAPTGAGPLDRPADPQRR